MPRAKLTPLSNVYIENRLTDRRGKIRGGKNRSQLNAAIGRVNQQQIIDNQDADFEALEWDRISPINGASPSAIFTSRNDISADGKVFLVRRKSDGHIILFQPFVPGVGGHKKITEADLPEISQDTRQKMVNDHATIAITRKVAEELDK